MQPGIDSLRLYKIYTVKFVRVLMTALISIILPVYLLAQGYSIEFVGIIISLTILSNIPFNIIVVFFSRKIKERQVLTLFSILMAISAMVFVWNFNATTVVIAAIVGLVSANGTETGPFQSIEQAIISSKSKDQKRTNVFSIYNVIGYAAATIGSLASGLPDYLASEGFALQDIFYIYAALAVFMALLYLSMKDLDAMPKGEKKIGLNTQARGLAAKFTALYSVDAFGGGFILKSLLTIWFKVKYNASLENLSQLFSIADIITAVSILLAPAIAKRIGLLNTMVLTHIPSNVFLILIPFAPSLLLTIIFYFLRQSISQMDVPTRQSYMNAIVKPEDRAATAALTNTGRSLAQTASPPLTTACIAAGLFTLPFVVGGGLKIVYDIAIYMVFRKIKPPEEL
ncbi:MAG TPA: MFS transporter [Candidatus Lokiarchaeia archaeon]|nr:MFS transporter [Candidatus Lokiarchaeia archaeon]